jgi:hypothetical protein
MAFAATEALMAYLKQMQAEGKILLPGELVRRVKAGPGLDSLGQAQRASSLQAGEQQGIETDTLTIVGRLESAWSGQSGDAARSGLRPLAEVATSASTALHDSQNALTDQGHAFQSTRDSLQDVSDESPSRDAVDVVTPWDTDTEDKINQRNAAVQQNNQIYQGFTATSDGHAQKMPIDYGQVPDAADGTFNLGSTPGTDTTPVTGQQHDRQNVTTGTYDNQQRPDTYSSSVEPPGSVTPWQGQQSQDHQVSPPNVQVPAASYDTGTHTAGYVPPSPGAGGTVPPGFGPTGSGSPYVPGSAGGFGPGGGFVSGVPGSLGTGTGSPGVRVPGSGGGSGSGSLPPGGGRGAPGKSSGTGQLGGVNEPGMKGGGGSGTGAPGARGANGMPMGAGAGKGGKEEDTEKKAASYLLEPDPNALFGYDGKATPPVIGK